MQAELESPEAYARQTILHALRRNPMDVWTAQALASHFGISVSLTARVLTEFVAAGQIYRLEVRRRVHRGRRPLTGSRRVASGAPSAAIASLRQRLDHVAGARDPCAAPSNAPATAAFVSVSPPRPTTRRSRPRTPGPRPSPAARRRP